MNKIRLEIPLEPGLVQEHVHFDHSGNRYKIITTVGLEDDKQLKDIMTKYDDIKEVNEIGNKIVKKAVNTIGELCYTESSFLLNMIWLYSVWYQYNVIVFLPSNIKNIHLFIKNQQDNLILINGNLESLSSFDSLIAKFKNPKNKLVVLFGYTELIFREIIKINKRRLNTVLKKIVKRASFVNFLSVTDIKFFELDSTLECEPYRLKMIPEVNLSNFINYSNFIDLYDYNNEFDNSVVTDLVLEKVNESKRVYISLDSDISVLKSIFNVLKQMDIDVSTNDNPDTQVVINSSSKTQKNYLVNDYNVFIISTPLIFDSVDLICYLNLILQKSPYIEVYLDSSKMKNIIKNIKKITSVPTKSGSSGNSLKFKDSVVEYVSYKECLHETGCDSSVQVTDYYFKLEPNLLPNNITKINLSNVTKEDYSVIRNHVKFYLENEISSTFGTCQLTTPSSPRDRYKKLNSLSTKISSYDYRCEVTCEIFNDHSIGIIVWNEQFANKKSNFSDICVGDSFIYQTTSGKWKYSVVV